VRRATLLTVRRLAAAAPPKRAQLARRLCEELGYEPDRRHPRTSYARGMRRIHQDRDPLIPLTADTVAVRDHVVVKVGREIPVPLLGVRDRAADISWYELPDRFALRASHGWDMTLLVRDKAAVGRGAALRQADARLGQGPYARTGAWGYRDIRPRLSAEELPEGDRGGVPLDSKLYVFDGRPRLLEVHIGRGADDYGFLFFNPDDLRPRPEFGHTWRAEVPYAPPPAARTPASLAARLGADFAFVRADLYLVGGETWSDELTH
jgi:hypothetical protein